MSAVAMELEQEERTTNRRLGKARDVADRLNISERQVWQLIAAGKLISGVKIGRSRRFDLDELDRYIAAGCPPVSTWEARRTAERKTSRSNPRG